MSFFEIQNFKFGLDSRRSELTTQPGAMEKLENAHVNQGGEIEKRKAFVNLGTLPENTFGLETTGVGVTTFGSSVPLAGLPAGVQFQQLVHPFVSMGGAYNAAVHAMTGIACSTSFGGKAWVAAQFADGNTYIYYDGVIIDDCINGIVKTAAPGVAEDLSMTIAQLATYIAKQNGMNVGPIVQTGTEYYFDMWSTAGLAYLLSVIVPGVDGGEIEGFSMNRGTGKIKTTNISNFISGINGAAATSTFTIVGGTAAQSAVIESIQVYDNSEGLWREILGVPVAMKFTDSLTSFANAVAGQIDTYTSGVNLTATSSQGTVTLSFDVSFGATQNESGVRITISGDCCLDNTIISLANNPTPSGYNLSSILMPVDVSLITATKYNGAGQVTVSGLTIGAWYYYLQSTNDQTLTMAGGINLGASGSFIATATVATLTGFADKPVTGALLNYIEVLGAPVTAANNALGPWVEAIATQVRAYCAAHSLNYTASATKDSVVVSRKYIASVNPNGGKTLVTTNSAVITDGSGSTPAGAVGFAVTCSPAQISALAPPGTISTDTITLGPITAIVTGGVFPLTFQWNWVAPAPVVGGSGKITLNPSGFTYGFFNQFIADNPLVDYQCSIVMRNAGNITGILQVTVTDANGNQVSAVCHLV